MSQMSRTHYATRLFCLPWDDLYGLHGVSRVVGATNATPAIYKLADEPREFELIHALNYRTFVEEIPQSANGKVLRSALR